MGLSLMVSYHFWKNTRERVSVVSLKMAPFSKTSLITTETPNFYVLRKITKISKITKLRRT